MSPAENTFIPVHKFKRTEKTTDISSSISIPS